MFYFESNVFDSKLCLRFTHDVVYGSISFIFIIIEYSFERSHDHALNHSTNGRDLSLFPVLDYYKYNSANYHDDDFWHKYLLCFFVFNSVLYFYFLNGMLYFNEPSYSSLV